MMLFATSVPNEMMHNRLLMLSFQVWQNATTVTLLSSGNCRHLPTAADLRAASHAAQESGENRR